MLLHIYIDGASRKNPGEAGAGIIIEDNKGNRLAELNKYLGIATNNEAEYKALIIALEHISSSSFFAKGKIKKLVFYSDSQLLVRQMNGEYAVKSPNILPLYKKAGTILKSLLKEFSFTYIPRELNKSADRLANLAIDSKLTKL